MIDDCGESMNIESMLDGPKMIRSHSLDLSRHDLPGIVCLPLDNDMCDRGSVGMPPRMRKPTTVQTCIDFWQFVNGFIPSPQTLPNPPLEIILTTHHWAIHGKGKKEKKVGQRHVMAR